MGKTKKRRVIKAAVLRENPQQRGKDRDNAKAGTGRRGRKGKVGEGSSGQVKKALQTSP